MLFMLFFFLWRVLDFFIFFFQPGDNYLSWLHSWANHSGMEKSVCGDYKKFSWRCFPPLLAKFQKGKTLIKGQYLS